MNSVHNEPPVFQKMSKKITWLGGPPGGSNNQGTYSVHYSLIFIVYNILFTICTLLKLYTIEYITESGEKKQGI